MINDIFVYIAFASIAGGITSATFLIFEKWIYKMTSASYMVFLNGFSILAFILPYYMLYFAREKGSILLSSSYSIAVITHTEISDALYTFLRDINAGRILSFIWFAGMAAYLVITIHKYRRLINDIKGSAFPIKKNMWYEVFDEIRKEGSNKAEVRLLFSDIFVQPFTTGVSKKFIVIPVSLSDSLSRDEIRFILMHEITHVRRNDIPFKLLIEILNCFHWFNPFFYFMKHRLDMWIEISCDESVNEEFSEEIKESYIELLIKIFEINARQDRKYSSFFASRKTKNIKGRLYAFMKKKEKCTMTAKVAVTCMAMCVFIGSSYVAKAADYSVYGAFGENKEIISENQFEEVNGDDFAALNASFPLIDKSEIISGNEDIEPYHIHDWIDTKVSVHEKNSDGSCDTKYCYAKKCTICGNYKIGEEYKSEHYAKCPH